MYVSFFTSGFLYPVHVHVRLGRVLVFSNALALHYEHFSWTLFHALHSHVLSPVSVSRLSTGSDSEGLTDDASLHSSLSTPMTSYRELSVADSSSLVMGEKLSLSGRSDTEALLNCEHTVF